MRIRTGGPLLVTVGVSLALATAACGGDSIGATDDGGGPGPDVSVSPDGGPMPDGGTLPDGGSFTTCAPAQVSDNLCIDCFNPELLGAFFDGLACHELWGCECDDQGSGDCDLAFATVAECEAAQSSCDGVLCVNTGGEWFPSEPCGPCGHYHCGMPSLLACCDAGCNCGPGKSFVPGQGCAVSAACQAEEACMATAGIWHPATECICGFTCGQPNPCDACLDSCDCGPYRNFDHATGCLLDAATCGAADDQGLCEATHGTWYDTGNGCGHFDCGLPNMTDPCVMPGCDCGPFANFDSAEGCVWDDWCILRDDGQPCVGSGSASNCRLGLVCCNDCGAPPGCPTCQPPCCEDSPICENNGCNIPPP